MKQRVQTLTWLEDEEEDTFPELHCAYLLNTDCISSGHKLAVWVGGEEVGPYAHFLLEVSAACETQRLPILLQVSGISVIIICVKIHISLSFPPSLFCLSSNLSI